MNSPLMKVYKSMCSPVKGQMTENKAATEHLSKRETAKAPGCGKTCHT